MMTTVAPPTTSAIYRVDKFTVPDGARDEFLVRVRETRDFLRRQPGLLGEFLLEKGDDGGTWTIVTIAIWEDQESVAAATAAVAAWRRQTGFDPLRLIRRLEIQADRGLYRPLA